MMPSFKVDLPRTVCGSECLNVETMAPIVNIFEISFTFGIDIVDHRGMKVEPLLHVGGIAHCT